MVGADWTDGSPRRILMPLCHMAGIHDDIPGDNLGVSIKFVASTGVPQGPPTWRFPIHMLDDRERTQHRLQASGVPGQSTTAFPMPLIGTPLNLRSLPRHVPCRRRLTRGQRATMSALRSAAAASREQYALYLPFKDSALEAWQLAQLDLQTRHFSHCCGTCA